MGDRRDRDRRRSKAEMESSRRPRRRESTKDSSRGTNIVEEPADMRPQYASPSTFLRPSVGEAASYYTQSPLAEPLTAPPVLYDNKPPHRLSVSSSGSSSYIDISRTFPGKRPRGVGALQAFFTTPAEHRRRPRRRKSQRTLNLGGKNSSSSSINSDLAYGTGFIKRRKGERRRSLDGGRRSSKNGRRRDTRDENPDAKILAVGAGLAALAKKQNTMDLMEARRSGSFYVKRQDSGRRQDLESSRGIGSSKIHDADEDGWYSDDSGSASSSIDSRLAYGGSTTDFFGFGGNKAQRPQPSRKSSVVDPKLFGPQNSLQGLITNSVGFEEVDYGNLSGYRPPSVAEAAKLAKYESRPAENTAMQNVYPISTSDPTRFDVAGSSFVSSQRNSRPEPVPLQHPQPYTPVSQSVYEPSISAPIVSGQRKSRSVAGAALAGVAGAAIGATILSEHRDERKESRRQDNDRDRHEDDRRREDRRERLPTQDIDSEKRSLRRHDNRDEPTVIEDRERRRGKGGKRRDDFDEDEIRRQGRRAVERNDPRDDKRESRRYGDRFDDKESRRPATIATAVDSFQYKDAKDAISSPEAAKGLESFTETNRAPSPAVITVERVPHFAKEQSSSIKDQGTLINDDDRRNYREPRDRKRTEREAEDAYEEIGHFTAPIEIGAIGAAVAAEREAEHRRDKEDEERRRRRDDDDDSDPRRREPRRSKKDDNPKRDQVQEEADRIYREAVLARKIASRKSGDDIVVRITTPPEMEHKLGPSPYDAPNADFHLDHVMDPTGFKEGITPIVEPQEFPLPRNYFHVQDEDVKANRRPLMTLVMPTPTPSPSPEKQKDRTAFKEADEATQSSESMREVKGSQTPSNGTRSVTWGENETKHYQPESPHEHKDEFIESTSKASTGKDESKPKKASRWGAVKGAFMGVGAAGGVAAANALVDATEAKKDAKPENESAKSEPYEYRGVVVEPELSDDEKARGPPAVGPKPPSPQPRSPVATTKVSAPHMPGSFADDLDFTAIVAAGLQDTGFDPNIVIDDPKYRRRNSPHGTNDDSKGLYRQPYAETVSDLGPFPEKSVELQKPEIEDVEHENDSRGVEVEFEDEFTTNLTRKEQRKREKAAKRQSTGDSRNVDPSEETPVTAMLVEEPERYFEPSKNQRNKKSKKSKDSYDDGDNKRVSVPIDEYDDLLENESKAEMRPVEWDVPSKKSKKKSKRESEIADSPSRSMSTAETYKEIPLRKSNDKSKRLNEQYEPEIVPADVIVPASEISTRSDESSKSRKSSKRNSSVADDHLIRSESNERRKSEMSSKRDSSPPDDRSQVSSKYADEGGSRSSKKKEREKENKNSGFFGLFGSSTSKSEPEPPQDDVEQLKKKKSKRSSTADSDSFVDAKSYPNGNNKYHDDPSDSKKSMNRDIYHDVEEGESYNKDGNSFLDNAGTLGTGVGLAGAAVLAAQHMQSTAADTDEDFDETNPFLYQVSDDAFSTPDASKDVDPFTEFAKDPDGSYKRVTETETRESNLGTAVSTAKDVIDPEISERQFRPSIDPQYGDLLPLPPSDPGSPDLKEESVTDLPELPESRPNSPPRLDQFSSRDRPSTLKKTDHQTPMKSPSASAVPLKFMMGNRSQPSSPRVADPSPVTSPAVASPESITLPSRPRPRPTSWDSTKEIQPLRLLDPSRRRDSVDQRRTQGVEAEQTLDKVKSVPDEYMEEESSKPAFAPGPDTSEQDSGSLVMSAIAGSAFALGTGALLSSLSNEGGVKRDIQTTEDSEEFRQPSPVQAGTKDRSSYLFHPTPPSKRSGDLEVASPKLELSSSRGENSSEVTPGTPTKAMQGGLQNPSIVNNEAFTEHASPDMMAIVADKAVAKTEEFEPPEGEPPSLSPPLACEMPTTEDRVPSEELSFIKPKKGKKGRKQTIDDILAQKEGYPTASPLVEQTEETERMDDLSLPRSHEKEKKRKNKQTFDDILAEEEVHPSVLPPAEEVKDFDHMDKLSLSKSKKDKISNKDKQKGQKRYSREEDDHDSLSSSIVLPPLGDAANEVDLVDDFSTPKSTKHKGKGDESAFELLGEEYPAISIETPPLEDPAEEANPDFNSSMSKSKKDKKKEKQKGANQDLEGPLSSSAVFSSTIDTAKRLDPTDEFRTPLEEPTLEASPDFEISTAVSKKDKKKIKNSIKAQSEESEFLSSSAILPPIENVTKEVNLPNKVGMPLPEPAGPTERDFEFSISKSKKDKKKGKKAAREQSEEPEPLTESIVLPSGEDGDAKDIAPQDDFALPLSKKKRKEKKTKFAAWEEEPEFLSNSMVLPIQEAQSRNMETAENLNLPLRTLKSDETKDFEPEVDESPSVVQGADVITLQPQTSDLQIVEETRPVSELADGFSSKTSKRDKKDKKDKRNRKSSSRAAAEEDPALFKSTIPVAELEERESKTQEKLSAATNRDADLDTADVEQDASVLRDIPVLQNDSIIPDEPADELSMSKSKKGKKRQSPTAADEVPAQIKPVANVEKTSQIESVQSQYTQDATETTEFDILQPEIERTSSRNEKNRHGINSAKLAGTILTGAMLSDVMATNEQPQDKIRAISPSREEPTISKAPDGFAAGFTAEQLEAARKMREDFDSGAMKTKKELMQDKKSGKGKKNRSTSTTPQQDLGSRSSYFQEPGVAEPEQIKEDDHGKDLQREGSPSQIVSGGFAARFTAEQLEDARQMREDFASGSMKTKKELKQEKKKRQSLLRTVTDGEIERSVDKGSEQASLPSSEVNSPIGTGASTPNIQEEFDEFSFAPKKSKEKKRQSSLLRTSTLDIDPSTEVLPTASTGLEGIQTEATDVTRGRKLEKTSDSSVPAEEEFSYSYKKSKKDKKAKKREPSTFNDDTPVDTPLDEEQELEVGTPGGREAEEVRLAPAEPIEENFYSSKKSKKDKKSQKRQSSAIGDKILVKTHPEVSREPESIFINAAESNVDQQADERQLETNEPAEEKFSLIKSKKDKKSEKRESSAFEDELPTEPPPRLSSGEPGNTSMEPNEPIASMQADRGQLSTREPAEEESYSLKNSKNSDKGKKRQSTSVSPFENEVVPTEETGSEITATATYLSDKVVTGRSLADQIWDSVISRENESTVAITEVPPAESDDPFGLTFSTKKSKKDKKKKKGSATATPLKEDFPSEPVKGLKNLGEIETGDVPKTALSEVPDESISPQAVKRHTSDEDDDLTGFSTGKKFKAKKRQGSDTAASFEEDFRPGSIQTDELSKIISTDPQAVSTVIQPETEDWSGFDTGKKSKKDKKKKGSVSVTTFEDGFEPATDMLKTSSHGLATEPGVNRAGTPDRTGEVEDWAGTRSGKMSKKDKKKARKDSKTLTLLELVETGSETHESPASNSVLDESAPLSWADEVADANHLALKDAVLEIQRHEEFGLISKQVFPESVADNTKINDTTVSQKMVSEPEPLAKSTTSVIIPEASHDKHSTVAFAAATGVTIVGTSLASDGSGKSPEDSKDIKSIPNFSLEPVSQQTEAMPDIFRSPSKKDKKGNRKASIPDRRPSATDDILDDSSLRESADPRSLGDDKNERAAEDGGNFLPVPVEVEPSIVEDSSAGISTAERLDRQAAIDMQKEDPQVRETPRQVSELRQMFEKEAPQEREGHGEGPQTREERDKEIPQVRESLREMQQLQEASELQELPQQREQPHDPEVSQSREFSDEITDVTEPGQKRAHEEVVDAALVAAGFHSVAGIDEALKQNATKGKSYQSGGVVPDQQWNDLPDDLITKPSKKSKKAKNKNRLAAWDVPTRDGESTIVEAPMKSVPQPEILVTMPQSHERENSDHRSREVVDPQPFVDQGQEITTSIPRDEDHARETVDPQHNSFNEPTWSFPGHDQLQLEKDQPSMPKTPDYRSHNTLRNQDHHRSSPAPLPVVIEEDNLDQQRFAKTSPEPELRFRGHDPNDMNRDSGLVTGSPISPHLAPYTDDNDHVRDSGVHLRDWPDSSPSKEKRKISSTDDALARMSWPTVDEESETVDLDRSQLHQVRSHPKDHSSKGSAIAAAAALAGAGIATQVARSVSDTSRERGSDKQSHTERRASDNFAERDSNKRVHPERRVSDKSDEKDSRERNRSDRRSSDGPDSDKRFNTEHRPLDKFEEEKANKESHTERRSISPNFTRLQTPDQSKARPGSVNSNRSTASATPPLRRSNRRVSGDLRSLSQHSQANLKEAKEAERSPATSIINSGPIVANEGRVRSKDMADVYDGFGEGRIGSPMSPTRPHSMRRRQSMQVLDLEARLEQLSAENRALSEAKMIAEQNLHASRGATSVLAARETEVDSLKQTIDWLHKEVEKLKEVNDGLTSANIALGQQHNQRYDTLATQHEQATRELHDVRTAHGSLSDGMESIVRNEVEAATHEKDREIEQLKQELEAAKEQIREMQRQILASKAGDSEFLTLRDEDYFDTACQTLCQHVQQWVLRFSKFSDMRACRLTSEINNDKIIDKLDNAVLDGSDVDNYLSDRVKRRDIFMSMTMTMIWEFVFARYLFGMDREQRQKLKALEKTLSEVGPAPAVHQWRATTLTLLAKREAFRQQREQDTEAVVQLVFQTLSEILPPPTQLEDQIQDQLRRVMKAAVDLSIEMRTQRAEYMMLPPLQPVYDPNGDLAEEVHFNAALMNERSGDTSSNEDLEAQEAVVRVVLFPLVVKKGDDSGEGDEEIVVCPAQVLVAKSKKQVRVFSPDRMDMSQNHSRVSMQSGMPTEQVDEI